MSAGLDPLIRDLVEWVAREPRPYAEVMELWRTSCPRLTVWEDAVERGYLVREWDGRDSLVEVTPQGLEFLAANQPGHDEVKSPKLAGLREALARGEADLAAGRFTAIKSDEELGAFFARL